MKIGFMGAGKMAEAILASLIKSRFCTKDKIYVSDVAQDRLDYVKRKYRINVCDLNRQVAAKCDVIFLCVKPYQLEDVMQEISSAVKSRHMVISIAAGKRLAFIEKHLPRARVVRVMPNLPCQVGAGVTAFCLGRKTKPKDRDLVSAMLKCFGKEVEMTEEHFDAVTAISGSGPAFFAYFLHCIIEAGQEMGVPGEQAGMLAVQTMLGTAQLLMQRKMNPIDLINAVKTPNGTTAAGVDVMERRGMRKIVSQVIMAAAERSREMSK